MKLDKSKPAKLKYKEVSPGKFRTLRKFATIKNPDIYYYMIVNMNDCTIKIVNADCKNRIASFDNPKNKVYKRDYLFRKAKALFSRYVDFSPIVYVN
jgi:hypothetical protein